MNDLFKAGGLGYEIVGALAPVIFVFILLVLAVRYIVKAYRWLFDPLPMEGNGWRVDKDGFRIIKKVERIPISKPQHLQPVRKAINPEPKLEQKAINPEQEPESKDFPSVWEIMLNHRLKEEEIKRNRMENWMRRVMERERRPESDIKTACNCLDDVVVFESTKDIKQYIRELPLVSNFPDEYDFPGKQDFLDNLEDEEEELT